jgi:hypothetical protein
MIYPSSRQPRAALYLRHPALVNPIWIPFWNADARTIAGSV